MNTRMILGVLIALVLIGGVRYWYERAYSAEAQEAKGRIFFRPLLPIRLVSWCAVVLGVPLVLILARSINLQRDWWIVAITSSVILASIVFRPYTIFIDDSGVSTQRYRIRTATIGWSQVAEIRPDVSRSAVTIVSRNGRSITHSQIHEDQDRFVSEAELHVRRAGL